MHSQKGLHWMKSQGFLPTTTKQKSVLCVWGSYTLADTTMQKGVASHPIAWIFFINCEMRLTPE